MMKGKLIIIEAGDGCGKATQTKALFEHLQRDGRRIRQVEFPDYGSQSSALIKLYLKGEFGKHADDVNAYAASTFFAVDRYASFRMNWKKDYDEGAIILADRYTTSNMVHQAVKIRDQKERQLFLDWLWDFEFSKMGLPIPDAVVFLDVPPQISNELIAKRAQAEHSVKDIHEADQEYLKRCYGAYQELVGKYDWLKIDCTKDGQLKTVEEIHQAVYEAVSKRL